MPDALGLFEKSRVLSDLLMHPLTAVVAMSLLLGLLCTFLGLLTIQGALIATLRAFRQDPSPRRNSLRLHREEWPL